MKKHQLLFLLVLVFSLFSCKKSTLEQELIADTTPILKVENGILSFKTHDDFLSTLVLLSQVSSEDRKNWEESIGFKSLASYLEEFDEKVYLADSLNDMKSFLKIKDEYSSIIIWEGDSSYRLNTSSFLMAKLVGKSGVFKVENDYYLNTKEGILKYSNLKDLQSRANPTLKVTEVLSEPGFLTSSMPPTNSFRISSLAPSVTTSYTSSRGRMWTQLRQYNLHSSTLGYRSFLTVEHYAEHRGVLPIWTRQKSMISMVQKTLFLKYSSSSTYVAVNYGNPHGTNTTFTLASGVKEDIILISERLKNLGLSNHPLSSYSNKFSSAVKTVNDDHVSSAAYWQVVDFGNFLPPLMNKQFLTLYGVSGGFLASGKFYEIPVNRSQQ